MNFDPATQSCHRAWIESFFRFYHDLFSERVHPDLFREPAVEAYLSELAVDRELAASSQTQALCARVVLYRDVRKTPLGKAAGFRLARTVPV